jgi:purine-nucleoside phosphorylase
MVRELSSILTNLKHAHSLGPTWTTDAPFRELRGTVLEHQRAGILAVDMEAAALFAVAQAAGCSAVAAFSITDQLADGHWRLGADLRTAQRGLTILFDAAVEFLSKPPTPET